MGCSSQMWFPYPQSDRPARSPHHQKEATNHLIGLVGLNVQEQLQLAPCQPSVEWALLESLALGHRRQSHQNLKKDIPGPQTYL